MKKPLKILFSPPVGEDNLCSLSLNGLRSDFSDSNKEVLFTSSRERSQNSFWHDFALGNAVGVGALSVNFAVSKGTSSLLEYFKIKIDEPQDSLRTFINSISNIFLRLIFKTFFIVYICILGPILEEWAFRGAIYTLEEKKIFTEQTKEHRFYRIFTNGILFGAAHLSPLQAWANVCIFSGTACAGMIFAALREYLKDWHASAMAHCAHNSTLLLIEAILK